MWLLVDFFKNDIRGSPRAETNFAKLTGLTREQVALMDTSSPPGSPTTYRRFNSREENVFSRLTASRQTLHVEHLPTKGVISNYQGKVSN